MDKWAAILVLWAAVMGVSFPAMAFEAGFREYYWLPKSSGPSKLDSSVFATDKQSLKASSQSDDYQVIEFFAVIGNHHLNLAYYGADKENQKPLSEEQRSELESGGLSKVINSALTHDIYDFIYRYDVLNLQDVLSGLSVGLVGRVKRVGDIAGMSSEWTDLGLDMDSAIPMLGVNFQLDFFDNLFETRLLATGVDYEHGTIFDGQADVFFSPLPLLDVYGGYRLFFIHADGAAQPDSDYVSGGPYVGITLSY